VLVQSDDWGRVGIPSLEVITELQNEGLLGRESPWDWYGLESADDVDALAAVLVNIRDSDGRCACMTANFIMGNADLRRMAAENWQEFHWLSIGEGFPGPWDADEVMHSYRRAIASGAFYPALHGLTHFNIKGLMDSLKDAGELGRRTRALAQRDIPYLRSITPEFNFALVRKDASGEHFLSESDQNAWIQNGVRAFEDVFGCMPDSTCAPGYRANELTYALFARAGIGVVEEGVWAVPQDDGGVLRLGRNVSFEPVLDEGDQVERALAQAAECVAAGLPITICTHSINYVSRFLGRAAQGREDLSRLLNGLRERFPNLRFASDRELLKAWRDDDDDWFRTATAAERMERIRRRAAGISDKQQAAKPELGDENKATWRTYKPALDGSDLEAATTANVLGSQTLYVAIGAIFTLIVGLPLQIYVARTLGAEGIGLIGIIEGGIATASSLLGFGIAQTAVRFLPFHIERREYSSARTLVHLGTFIMLGVGLVSYAVLLASMLFLDHWWPELSDHQALVALLGITMPLGFVVFFLQQSLRGFHDIRYMIIGSSFIQLTAKAGLMLVLLGAGWGLVGYSLAMVASILCAILWMGMGLFRHLRSLPAGGNKAEFAQWRRYAIISYLGGIVSGAPTYLDRFIIAFLAGTGLVGVLVIARRIQQLPGVFTQMLLMVGAPMLAKAHGRGDAVERQRLYGLMTDWMVRASLPLLLFLGIFAGPVIGLFGPEFAAKGRDVLLILLCGQVFNVLCGPVGTVGMMSGLESKLLRINTIGNGAGFLLMFILIPAFGAVGAAAASVAGWVLVGSMVMIVVHRDLGMHWWDDRFRNWFAPAVVTLLIGLLIRSTALSLSALSLAFALVALYGVFFGVGLIQGLHDDDRELLRYVWRVRLRQV
jgi:O-antigen/teichoic acid export membrane protein